MSVLRRNKDFDESLTFHRDLSEMRYKEMCRLQKLNQALKAECEASHHALYGQFNSEESLDTAMAEHLKARAARLKLEEKE